VGESGPTCVICGVGRNLRKCWQPAEVLMICIQVTACASGVSSSPFESQTEQRLHFKSDWHRFNVKLRSNGKSAVDEAEFERLVSEKDEVNAAC